MGGGWCSGGAVNARSGVQAAVFVVKVDGTGLRQLAPWGMLAGDPDWSPDRRRIVFNMGRWSTPPTPAGPSSTPSAPTGPGCAASPPTARTDRARPSPLDPDSKAILYTRTTQTGRHGHVYAINADGTGDTPVLTAKPIYTHPILQPTPRTSVDVVAPRQTRGG